MSTKRYLDTKFWSDPWIMTLTPAQKYFYLYLLTNTEGNIAGVYEISKKKMSFDTGYDEKKVDELLSFFDKEGKVSYLHNYIVIKNFIKHQNCDSEKIRRGIEKIINTIPIPYRKDIYTVCIGYGYLSRYLNLNLNLNLNTNLNLNADADTVTEVTPPQENYSSEIFNLWKEASLPCSKDLLTFTSRDFKQSLQYLKGYHSNEVIEAVKNYISVLADSYCWVTAKMTFYGFVTWKRFADFIPGNFQHENFLSWDKRGKKTASAPKTELHEEKQYYKCPKCGKPSLFADTSSMQWLCSDCSSSFPLMDLTPEACNG